MPATIHIHFFHLVKKRGKYKLLSPLSAHIFDTIIHMIHNLYTLTYTQWRANTSVLLHC